MAKKNKKKKSSKQAKSAKPTMAALADRHELYQESVQDSEFELDFVQDTFKDLRGRKPVTLREDCLLYTSPSPRDATLSRMPSSA